MHPRIQEVKKLLEELKPEVVLSKQTLEYLAKNNVSVIEACFAISLTYSISFEKVSDFIYPDDIFPYLDIQEAFAQTMEYANEDEQDE